MHMFKVTAILFMGIAISFGKLDISSEYGEAIIVDRCNLPVSVSVGDSGSLGTLPSSGIYHERFKKRYFSTAPGKEIIPKVNSSNVAAANGILSLSLYNNLGNGAYAYVIGKDINDQVIILQPDGSFFYPNSNGAAAPVRLTQDIKLSLGALGSTSIISIPAYISSARIYFAMGELRFFIVSVKGETSLIEPSAINSADPSAAINWGFVELTHISSGVWANISCVDFVGLPLGISLTSTTGTVQSTAGLTANAVASICNDLCAQTIKDGQPWNKLCITSNTGTALRVLAPINYINVNPNAFKSYWTDYINQVWLKYTSIPLIIDTQMSTGKVQCQVSGDILKCAGDNRNYAKPTAFDIFGCNTGPFEILALDNDIHRAVVPRLCAAFNRSTFLISGGNVQPSLLSSSYYSTSPTNHFSRIVHKYELDGKGYAFSYDDVNPSGEDQSGTVSTRDPLVLAIRVGGA